ERRQLTDNLVRRSRSPERYRPARELTEFVPDRTVRPEHPDRQRWSVDAGACHPPGNGYRDCDKASVRQDPGHGERDPPLVQLDAVVADESAFPVHGNAPSLSVPYGQGVVVEGADPAQRTELAGTVPGPSGRRAQAAGSVVPAERPGAT